MTEWTTHILADADGGIQDLIWIVAILLLSIVGAIAEKLKRMGGPKEPPEEPRSPKPIRPPEPAPRPVQPQRARPQRPLPRAAETGPTRPRGPGSRPVRPPAPPRAPMAQPVARPGTPARPPAPAPVAPPPRPAQPSLAVKDLSKVEVEGPLLAKDLIQPITAQSPKATAPPAQKLPAAAIAPPVGSFRDLSLAEVRRAIVLNEILGRPLALRPYDEHSF